MNRLILLGLGVAVLALAGSAGGAYWWYLSPDHSSPVVPPPTHATSAARPIPSAAEFEHLARTDPVAMLAAGLDRYTREVTGGFRATLEKRERVFGKLQELEVLDLAVRDTPPAVLMKWRQGGPSGTAATLYVEPDAGKEAVIQTWRPKAWVAQEMAVPLKSAVARGSSRYCMKDSGLFRGSLRTKTVWEAAQKAGTFRFEYLGANPVEKAGGRVCHTIRRTCDPEADGFALDEPNPTDPKTVARDGFNEILLMVDAGTWLQVGTELWRRGPGGDELIGSYYFRDIVLNPAFPPDTFTAAGLKAK